MKRGRLSLTAIVLCLGLAVPAVSQVFPLGILPSPPPDAEPLNAYVWTMESVFDLGDPIEIFVSVDRPAFVYLFDLQPDGLVRMIFPNALSATNFLTTSSYRLPDGGYALIAQPPTGIEELLVFATEVPLPVPIGSPEDPFPVFAATASEAMDQLVTLLDALDETTTWAIGWTAIQIVGDVGSEPEDIPMIEVPALPQMPPFVGSIGAAWYVLNGSWVPGFPDYGWYWYYGIEASWHLCWALQ